MSRSEAHEARNQALRAALGSVPAAREASVPTRDIVASECQRLAVPLKVEDVPDSEGARLHWIGDSSFKDVMLYFHGGGFGLSAFPGHVMFLVKTQQRLAVEGKSLAIAVLEYGLTPAKTFPTQHMQAVQALKHILQSCRKPSDVIIAGDSAGGNMTLGVLSATTHSRAGIPAMNIDSPLKGALLISPWTSFSSDVKSFTDNIDKDIIAKDAMGILINDFVPAGTKDEFAEPALADSKWWANTLVDSVLNLGGGHEIFLDYIKDLGAKMKEAGLNVETTECPLQVHVDCILDAQAGLEPGPMSIAIWDWVEKLL